MRIIFILGVVTLFAAIFGDERLFFNQIILGIILVIQIGELVRYVNKTNRELSKFLAAIKQSDFSINFSGGHLSSSFKNLHETFDAIINSYKKVKIEREAQYHFLQMLVEHIHVGIISVESGEKIILLNQPAKRILNLPDLRTWRAIKAKNPEFTEEIENLEDEGKKLIEIKVDGENKNLSVDVSSLKMIGKDIKLVTFKDIKSEIEQKEIEAWHKLIRILTHEIMNSVTPISSLTETMQMVLKHPEGKPKKHEEINDETLSDILFSLGTIQKRSDAMLSFVEDYRKLTKVPKPDKEPVPVKDLFETVSSLMEAELKKKNIKLELVLKDKNMKIDLDRKQIEQILINLITNSVHATSDCKEPEIQISAYQNDGIAVVEVKDNGAGMDPSEMEQIFVPFFSTKDDGSGIGLSLSKQIMNLHHGNIRVDSHKGKGTSFYLEFR